MVDAVGAIKRSGFAAMLAVLLVALTPAVHALECEGVPLDGGCLFTVTGGDTPDPDDGFAVTNANDVPMWDFVEARDRDALGYPISQRWTDGPFTLQAFQKAILQWDPGKQRMNYYNTLDVLANRYPDVELPFVPAHRVLEADRGATFGTIIRNHLALLDQNEAIKARFLSEPDWLNLYGLPIRYEEREVDGHPQGVQMLRTQRTVFVVWNVPTPGTTVGRVNLQNVPDKVKKLSDVIIPDHAKAPVDERGRVVPTTPMSAAIFALPWAADGITPLERQAIDRLKAIADTSLDLFWYLMRELDLSSFSYRFADPLGAAPTADTVRTYDLLIDIAGLAWVQNGLTNHERDAAQTLYRSAILWPAFVEALLQQPWVTDSLAWEAFRAIKWLYFLLYNTGIPTAWDAPPTRWWHAANIGIDILQMPFLDSIDGYEAFAIRQLQGVYGRDFDALKRAVAHLNSKGWLTDEQVIRLLFAPLSKKPGRDVPTSHISDIDEPEQLDRFLDPAAPGPLIYLRRISTPYSPDLPLIIVSDTSVATQTMNALEESVRDLESAMGIALPFGRAIVVVGTALFTSYHPGNYVWLNADAYLSNHQVVVYKDSYAFVHELGHQYFHGGGEWLSEGGTTFLEYFVLNASSIATGEWPIPCPTDRIADIANEPGQWFGCPYRLGADLFLDLYNNLGAERFFDAFRRLHLMLIDSLIVSESFSGPAAPMHNCCEGVEPGLYYIRRAFVTEASPEVAAIADPIIQHRYYVGDR